MTEFSPRTADIVREEIADLSAVVGGFPEPLRRTELAAAYFHRLQGLREELNAAELLASPLTGPTIDARFDRLRGLSSLPASFVGRFLQTFQALYDALGQAATGRITRSGVVAREIADQTRLQVAPFVPGSFVVRMAIDPEPAPQVDNLGRTAFTLFEELVSAGHAPADLATQLTRLRSRVASNYAKLLQLMVEQQVDFVVTLAAQRGQATVRRASLPLSLASAALPALQAAADAQREELVVDAVLNMANARTGGFEIDLGDDGTIVGRALREQVSFHGLQIGAIYRFRLLKIMSKNSVTSEYTDEHLLVGVAPRT
jgi:hypothetical protein